MYLKDSEDSDPDEPIIFVNPEISLMHICSITDDLDILTTKAVE